MGWFTGIVVFILTWWVVLFTVLPFGHVRNVDGTSVDARMKEKVIATTMLSIIVWIVIYLLIDADLVSFRDMARVAAEEREALS